MWQPNGRYKRQVFQLENLTRSVFTVSPTYFDFWKASQMASTCSKLCKHEFLKFVWNMWICMKTSLRNIFKVNNNSTRTTWVSLLWCLLHQLQRHRYWEPSQTSTIWNLFAKKLIEKRQNFQLNSKYTSELWTEQIWPSTINCWWG